MKTAYGAGLICAAVVPPCPTGYSRVLQGSDNEPLLPSPGMPVIRINFAYKEARWQLSGEKGDSAHASTQRL